LYCEEKKKKNEKERAFLSSSVSVASKEEREE